MVVGSAETPMPVIGPEGREQLKIAVRYGAFGIELVLSIVIGYFGGQWLDGKLGTAPYLQWVGLGLGMVAGFRSLYQLVKKTHLEKL